MFDENRLRSLLSDIDTVLGWGGAWDTHRFLGQLKKQIEQVLEENNNA